MNCYGYIYKTTNLINGKVYIGLHRGSFDPSYLGSGKILLKAIKQYGVSSFKVEPIDYAENENILNALEIMHIGIARRTIPEYNIYNISCGGSAPMNGRKHSVELKERWSKERTGNGNTMFGVHLIGDKNGMWGKQHSDASKKKMSERALGRTSPIKGIQKSPEAREKMRFAWIERKKNFPPSMLGKHLSEETKQKIRESKVRYFLTHPANFKGKKHSEETKIKMRKPHNTSVHTCA